MSKVYYIGNLSTNDSKDTKIFKNIFSTHSIDFGILSKEALKLSSYDLYVL